MLPKIAEVGRLWADPEIRYTAGGKAVCTLPLVFSKRKKNEDGTWVDDGSLFVRGTLWDKYAENAANCLAKGDQVFVVGELMQREYETKDGEKRTSLELKVYDCGPTLRWNEAKLSRAERSSQAGPPVDDPWASTPPDSSEAPF